MNCQNTAGLSTFIFPVDRHAIVLSHVTLQNSFKNATSRYFSHATKKSSERNDGKVLRGNSAELGSDEVLAWAHSRMFKTRPVMRTLAHSHLCLLSSFLACFCIFHSWIYAHTPTFAYCVARFIPASGQKYFSALQFPTAGFGIRIGTVDTLRLANQRPAGANWSRNGRIDLNFCSIGMYRSSS